MPSKLAAKLKAIKLRKGQKADKDKEALDAIKDEGALPKIDYGGADDNAEKADGGGVGTDPTMSNERSDDEYSGSDGEGDDRDGDDRDIDYDPPVKTTSTSHVVGAADRNCGGDAPTSGEIMGRVTMNKMFVNKNWQEMAWFKQNEHTIVFFKNKQDYLDWRHRSSNGNDNMYTDEQREELIKSKIDFMLELGKPNVRGYTLSPVTGKAYEGCGYLYQFKLDAWMKLGPVTVAALGSTDKGEAQDLYDLINEMYAVAYDAMKDDKEFYPAAKPQLPQPTNNIIYS